MYLKQKYRIKTSTVSNHTRHQVECLKDWDGKAHEKWIGVSREFEDREEALRFLAMLENTQEARAALIVRQERIRRRVWYE